MKFWDFDDISYFPKILSCSATREETCIQFSLQLTDTLKGGHLYLPESF